jgi:RNA polymerase sigma-70 factor (ECF subfamily)
MRLFSFDDDYVRRLREGDRETEAHFHSYFRDLLFAKLRRRLSSTQAIDDIRQEVFTRTIERLGQLEDGRKLGAFVNTICNNVLLEYYRQDSRVVSIEEQPDIAETADLDMMDKAMDVVQSRARIRRVLESLDPREAEILRAVFLEEADKQSICERFGVDRQYLRVLLHRAKAKFRAAYLRRLSGRREIFETFGTQTSLLM